MDVVIYEEKKLRYNKTQLVEYKNTEKNYYEEEIKYLKEREVIKLLSTIKNDFHRMLFSFLFETAARVSEALSVRLSDIDFYNNTVKLYTLKRKSKNIVRVLTISDSLLNMILIYEKEVGLKNTDYLFTKKPEGRNISIQAANKLFKKYFMNILGQEYLKLAHPHTMRHSRAVQLLNSGEVNVVQLQKILGHANIMNTLVYLKYSNKDIQDSIKRSNQILGIK